MPWAGVGPGLCPFRIPSTARPHPLPAHPCTKRPTPACAGHRRPARRAGRSTIRFTPSATARRGSPDQARLYFRQQGRSTVDRFHVCDYLAAAAPDPAHTKAFVAPLGEALRASDHPRILTTLRPRSEHHDVPDPNAQCAPRSAIWTTAPTNSIRTAPSRSACPSGSGLIESGHPHALQSRLKQAGARWPAANAHALRQLRNLHANLR